ncbi:MAG: hypothetical protein AAF456_22545 [Planctomycetota bacterium]
MTSPVHFELRPVRIIQAAVASLACLFMTSCGQTFALVQDTAAADGVQLAEPQDTAPQGQQESESDAPDEAGTDNDQQNIDEQNEAETDEEMQARYQATYETAMAQIAAGELIDGYRELVMIAPLTEAGYAPAHLELARFLYAQGPQLVPGAKRHYDMALEADPESADVAAMNDEMEFARRVVVQLRSAADQQNFEPAIGVIEIDMNALTTEIEAGTAGPNAAAREKFLRLVLLNCYTNQVVVSAQNRGDPATRLAYLRRILELDPGNRAAKHSLARVVLANADVSAAARLVYDPMTDPAPPPIVLTEIGTTYVRQNMYVEAAPYFRRALALNETNPLTMNNLAYCYLRMPEPDIAKATEMVNAALEATENLEPAQKRSVESFVYDTQASIFRAQGRFDEAVAAYQAALRGRPRDRNILEAILECRQLADEAASATETSDGGAGGG